MKSCIILKLAISKGNKAIGLSPTIQNILGRKA